MKKIYGNHNLLETLNRMNACGRNTHSLIFYGEKGSGRKLFAEYYTAQLMCENPIDGAPCGICPACRNVSNNSHPDVNYVRTEGKLESYTVSIAREIISDSAIKPNNHTNRKVYIFRDCRKMSVQTQNMLLKLIEEPPDHAYFIFTAEAKYEFLPTIISRCTCLGVSPCTDEEALQALAENGVSPDDAAEAVSCFHGCIGMCMDYLNNEELKKQVDLTKSLTDSIINRNEYALDLAFHTLGSSKNNIREVLTLADKLFRDAAVLDRDSNAAVIGCYPAGAKTLAGSITAYQAARIHEKIETAWRSIDANVSAQLTLTALCGEIMEIVL